jgi:hypothetical protein
LGSTLSSPHTPDSAINFTTPQQPRFNSFNSGEILSDLVSPANGHYATNTHMNQGIGYSHPYPSSIGSSFAYPPSIYGETIRMPSCYYTTKSSSMGNSPYPEGHHMSFETQPLMNHGGPDRSGLCYELEHTSRYQQPDPTYAQNSRHAAPPFCPSLASDLDDTNARTELTCDQCGEKFHGR